MTMPPSTSCRHAVVHDPVAGARDPDARAPGRPPRDSSLRVMVARSPATLIPAPNAPPARLPAITRPVRADRRDPHAPAEHAARADLVLLAALDEDRRRPRRRRSRPGSGCGSLPRSWTALPQPTTLPLRIVTSACPAPLRIPGGPPPPEKIGPPSLWPARLTSMPGAPTTSPAARRAEDVARQPHRRRDGLAAREALRRDRPVGAAARSAALLRVARAEPVVVGRGAREPADHDARHGLRDVPQTSPSRARTRSRTRSSLRTAPSTRPRRRRR